MHVGCVYSVCLSGGVWQRQGKWMGEEVYASLFVLCAWIIKCMRRYLCYVHGLLWCYVHMMRMPPGGLGGCADLVSERFGFRRAGLGIMQPQVP